MKKKGVEGKVLEELAELKHEQWEFWSKDLACKEKNISQERIEKWKQLWMPYSKLPEDVKEQYRVWARKVLKLTTKDVIGKVREKIAEEVEKQSIEFNSRISRFGNCRTTRNQGYFVKGLEQALKKLEGFE